MYLRFPGWSSYLHLGALDSNGPVVMVDASGLAIGRDDNPIDRGREGYGVART